MPDFAIGRIPAETVVEATNVVQKIKKFDIQFDMHQQNPQDWLQTALFVADITDDGAGNFCEENRRIAQLFPDDFNIVLDGFCLESVDQIPNLREKILIQTGNSQGVSLFNYRGHGSVSNWGNNILNAEEHADWWLNTNRPFVLVSADCLDGYFALPGSSGLGETFLKSNVGSVAHWSSTGLGTTAEHTLLETHFYTGIFEMKQTALGDAARYAKLRYLGDDSLIYSFTLVGDPALQMWQSDFEIYLPVLHQQ